MEIKRILREIRKALASERREPRWRPYLEQLEQRIVMSTFSVDSSLDLPDGDLGDGICDTGNADVGYTGLCTLRAAIENANRTAGPHQIGFTFSGTISVSSSLPAISRRVTINAGREAGAPPRVRIDGGGAASTGVFLAAGSAGSTVRGLSITGFFWGIYATSGGNAVVGNYIGLTPGGVAAGNLAGVGLFGVGNRVGTNGDGVADEAESNVISGNQLYGLYVTGDGHVVAGNYIGTDPSGTAALANGGYGVSVFGNGNRIGTNGDDVADVEERNVISANAYGGVYVAGDANTPEVDNLVMIGVPNLGAPKAWNPLHDDWGPGSLDLALAYAPMVNDAYQKVLAGRTIAGPNPINLATISAEGRPDPRAFVRQYVGTLRALVPTYPFLDPAGDGLDGVYADVNGTALGNAFLLDLNSGDYLGVLEERLGLRPTVVYGAGPGTGTQLVERIGPTLDTVILGFEGLSPRSSAGVIGAFAARARPAAEDEPWYEPLTGSGDGTVAVVSAVGPFLDSGFAFRQFDADHAGLMRDPEVQSLILDTLLAGLERGNGAGAFVPGRA